MTHAPNPLGARQLNESSPAYGMLLLLILYLFAQPAYTQNVTPNFRQAMDALLASKQHPLLSQADFSPVSDAVKKLYQLNANQAIWLGADQSPKNREDALSILSKAAEDGLSPASYDAERLRNLMSQALKLAPGSAAELASYDVALSIALVRYARDLHVGRVDPRTFAYPLPFAAKLATDIATLLNQHIQRQDLLDLPRALAPESEQYPQLKTALSSYQQQAKHPPLPKLSFAKSLHPGEQHEQVPELRRHLQDLGELTAAELSGVASTDTTYDPATTEAVKRLQQLQGLTADGLIGKQTQSLLNLSAADKVRMIELAMERLRWLPDLPEGPRIFVNIPAFQLWAFNAKDDQQPLTMKVIVGKAEQNQTPVLWENMKYLEFMPYWNIPKSIMDKEMLPKLESDGSFLANQDIELVERRASEETEDQNQDEEQAQEAIVDDIRNGRFRARQRPGSNNPLGRVKFIFPNKAEVYLHDTPGKAAFNRDRRDLSHGCVRVADAEKLAQFVLGDQAEWSLQSIQQAMAGPQTQRVSLKRSIPVLFFYTTAFVDRDHKLRFYPDIYGYDSALQSALNRGGDLGSQQQLVSKSANPGSGG